MLLSTNQELRLHIPSNAVDDVTLLSGIIDNSEKDFLRDKLGNALYDSLCQYYDSIDPQEFYNNVINGSYTADPWAELLLNAQRMICNDALARFAYQQVISVNGSGVNVVSGNDYGAADDRLLDKGVGGYKKEAAIACNNLLILLEDWSKQAPQSSKVEQGEEATVPDGSPSGEADGVPTSASAIDEIVKLWSESKYYFYHSDLLIPTAHVLQHYLDIYENREKFIRLLPDLHFIQEEYIEDAIGQSLVSWLLDKAIYNSEYMKVAHYLLKKLRRITTAYLEQRTTVLSIDKQRRQQAHDESVALKTNLLNYLRTNQTELPKDIAEQCPFYDNSLWEQPTLVAPSDDVPTPTSSTTKSQKTFRTRLMY